MSGWTEERAALALKLWNEGKSASEVARALGVSRNAALGKVKRMGAPPRPVAAWSADRPHRSNAEIEAMARRKAEAAGCKAPPVRGDPHNVNPLGKSSGHARQARAGQQWVAGELQRVEPTIIPFTDETAAPGEVGTVSLLELASHHCRWPIGDPGVEGFAFCGAAKIGDGPYCSRHAKKAVQPAKGWLSDKSVGIDRKHRRTSTPTFDDYVRRAG